MMEAVPSPRHEAAELEALQREQHKLIRRTATAVEGVMAKTIAIVAGTLRPSEDDDDQETEPG